MVEPILKDDYNQLKGTWLIKDKGVSGQKEVTTPSMGARKA